MPHLKMSLYSHHLTHCEDVAVDVEAHVEACEGDAISAVGIMLVAGTRIFCKNADQGRTLGFRVRIVLLMFFSLSGADTPYAIHNTALCQKRKGFTDNLQLRNHLEIHGPSASAQTSRSFSGRQAAFAGLVLGSFTAAMPDTGCRYFV